MSRVCRIFSRLFFEEVGRVNAARFYESFLFLGTVILIVLIGVVHRGYTTGIAFVCLYFTDIYALLDGALILCGDTACITFIGSGYHAFIHAVADDCDGCIVSHDTAGVAVGSCDICFVLIK